MTKPVLLIFTATVLLFSCLDSSTPGRHGKTRSAPDSYSATHFKTEVYGDIIKLTISDPWQESSGNIFIYYLLPDGLNLPDTIRPETVIRIPVKRIICMSTTHLAMLRALKAEMTIAGISGTDMVYDTVIRGRITEGKIPDVGYENSLDRELIVSLSPDVLISYGIGAASADYFGKLREMGVKVVFNADYLEEHPLARCEWIKVFGLLTGTQERADSIFNMVKAHYLRLVDSVASANLSHPRVLMGAPWEDVWYISPSNSYSARLVEDAGGDYLFNDLIAPNSRPFATETVFSRATKADIWLNPGAAYTLGEIKGQDYRMAQLPAFVNKKVYNHNRRAVKGAGNDYWESAVVRPDVVLRDIVSILHPGFIPGYTPVYYKEIE